jgi:hypothetical protein
MAGITADPPRDTGTTARVIAGRLRVAGAIEAEIGEIAGVTEEATVEEIAVVMATTGAATVASSKPAAVNQVAVNQADVRHRQPSLQPPPLRKHVAPRRT